MMGCSLLLLWWSLLLPTFVHSFVLRYDPPRQRLVSLYHHHDALNEAIQRVSNAWETMNESELAAYLVQRGMNRMKKKKPEEMKHAWRVPGCIARVEIEPILAAPTTSKETSIVVQELRGTADAHVSRGLLDIVEELICGLDLTVCNIQNVTAKDLKLDGVLSPGRTNGLTSMLSVIHDICCRQTMQAPRTVEYDQQRPSVALLLSGGVDSSVALHMLLEQNYNVTAFYLKIWLEDAQSHLSTCPWEEDVLYCQQVCEQANVEFQTLSLQHQYHETVIQTVLHQAQMGRTPNPDILCNSRIKFGVFWDKLSGSFDYLATGHYAQIERNETHAWIRRAPDPVKDQSYFLSSLSQHQLERVLFPIGHLEKSEVRQRAEVLKLPNRHRPDSQGLCFLGKVKFEEFLASYLPNSEGKVVDALTGQTIGEHRGLHFHTVGQRRGMGKVLYPRSSSSGPWYVVAKDVSTNVLYCTNAFDDASLESSRSDVTLESVHWQIPGYVFQPGSYDLKIRHGPKLSRGYLNHFENDHEKLSLHLESKDSGLAPGQSIVIYTDDGICLGSGIISEQHWKVFLQQHGEYSPIRTVTT